VKGEPCPGIGIPAEIPLVDHVEEILGREH
jgi:hypothetical protein